MSSNKNECDTVVVVIAIVVFALPLTLLIPDFSVWDVVPKVRVIRFHVLQQHLSWPQLNAIVVALLILFFSLYLEIRKRNLDDMVEKVLTVSQATDTVMLEEKNRQAAALRLCVELLDVSAEHYEHLVLLRDELARKDKPNQQPPVIEPSGSML
ncbi:uncharacterized protein LOC106143675 [Amyelois transitella]|uniref:uncharacterized protein LOC106143675 n=1 Tax=Amyelois transitella TaxID=680683 RepID=UPI00067CDE8A|nr:uncharacterized protein LOC106143675 [Amyelois transitella]